MDAHEILTYAFGYLNNINDSLENIEKALVRQRKTSNKNSKWLLIFGMVELWHMYTTSKRIEDLEGKVKTVRQTEGE